MISTLLSCPTSAIGDPSEELELCCSGVVTNLGKGRTEVLLTRLLGRLDIGDDDWIVSWPRISSENHFEGYELYLSGD